MISISVLKGDSKLLCTCATTSSGNCSWPKKLRSILPGPPVGHGLHRERPAGRRWCGQTTPDSSRRPTGCRRRTRERAACRTRRSRTNENVPRTPCSRPMVPSCASSRTLATSGWCRYMKASVMITPCVRAADCSVRTPAPSSEIGFSTSTCLLGLGRLLRPLDVHRVRQRDVDGVDVGIGEQFLVAAVRSRNALRLGVRACTFEAARGDGQQLVSVGRQRADERTVDAGNPEDSPAERRRRFGHGAASYSRMPECRNAENAGAQAARRQRACHRRTRAVPTPGTAPVGHNPAR